MKAFIEKDVHFKSMAFLTADDVDIGLNLPHKTCSFDKCLRRSAVRLPVENLKLLFHNLMPISANTLNGYVRPREVSIKQQKLMSKVHPASFSPLPTLNRYVRTYVKFI